MEINDKKKTFEVRDMMIRKIIKDIDWMGFCNTISIFFIENKEIFVRFIIGYVVR